MCPQSTADKELIQESFLAHNSYKEIGERRIHHTTAGDVMKKLYRFNELSKNEREFLEMILMEEIDVQAWYAITYSCVLSDEVFMCIQ
jgi:hypothetical protein